MVLARRILLALMLAYWTLIGVLTHLPRLPAGVPHVNDKVAHFLAYGALGGILFLVMWTFRPAWRWIWLAVWIIAISYGALDEWTQHFFPPRQTDFRGDWVCDILGSGIAVISLGLLQRLLGKRLPEVDPAQ